MGKLCSKANWQSRAVNIWIQRPVGEAEGVVYWHLDVGPPDHIVSSFLPPQSHPRPVRSPNMTSQVKDHHSWRSRNYWKFLALWWSQQKVHGGNWRRQVRLLDTSQETINSVTHSFTPIVPSLTNIISVVIFSLSFLSLITQLLLHV